MITSFMFCPKGLAPILSNVYLICYYPCFDNLLDFRLRTINPRMSISGNTVATSSPILRLPPTVLETLPTIAGLTVAPKSPAKAKNANIAVPPFGHFCDEMLIDPGHIIPTEIPQNAQPASPIIGKEDKDAVK